MERMGGGDGGGWYTIDQYKLLGFGHKGIGNSTVPSRTMVLSFCFTM